MNRIIPFSPPDITENEIEEVIDALRSGWITTGPKVKKLEEEIAKRCHTQKAVCLGSNTACMEMTLRILGIGPGDEVIVPAYTYTASASVVEHVGAKLILVDCAKDKFTMDYEKLENAITNKTKAIIPVDLFGIPCEYEEIFQIAENKRELFNPGNNEIQRAIGRVIILADAAHAFGAYYKDRPIGSVADFTCFSFHAVKNLTTAEGGAVTWRPLTGIDDEELYHYYMLLSLHGQSKDALAKVKNKSAWEYDIVGLWYKCNMTDIHAAIGLAQIRRYEQMLKRRKDIICQYSSGLTEHPITVAEHYTDKYRSSGHLFVMRLNDHDETMRNRFIEKMAELGISTNVHYKPLPMHTGYQKLGFSIKDYPNAYRQYENEVTLPLYSSLSDADIEYVIESVLKIIG